MKEIYMLKRNVLSVSLVALGCLGVLSSVQAAPITLSNATTSVVVNGGEADNGLVPDNGYFRYTDIAASEETTWSIDPLLRFAEGTTAVLSNGATGGFGSPTDLGGGVVRSTATTRSISTQADTELVGSNAKTTFTFTAATGATLDGATFVFYAENDLFGFDDDAAAFTGSIAGGDLALFMYDTAAGGLTVKLTGEAISGAALSLFGADLWTGFGTALEGGDLSVLSADGSNFETVGDLGLALAFSLSGTSATVIINYDTQPLPPDTNGVPEPNSLALVALGLAAALYRRRGLQKSES